MRRRIFPVGRARVAQRLALLALALGATSPAFAAGRLGVGPAAAYGPALSVQFARGTDAPQSAWHVLAHYRPGVAGASLDHQWRYTPAFGWGRGFRLDLYSGLGLAGASDRDAESREVYRLRLPIGLQWNLDSLRLAAFLEGAPTVGPLPRTTFAAAAAAGLRATF
jgi:hypothetical protein